MLSKANPAELLPEIHTRKKQIINSVTGMSQTIIDYQVTTTISASWSLIPDLGRLECETVSMLSVS